VPRSTLAALAVAVLAAYTLTACRSEERSAAWDSAASDTAAPASPNVVTVRATNYAFDAPTEIPAGLTTFRLVNDGPGLHHMQLVRLDSGKTFDDLQAALKRPGPPPRWMVPVGGPNAPDPKREANATMDLPPGDYAMFCFVDLPEKMPHFMKGMSRPLTVSPNSSATAAALPSAPKADVVIRLVDYAFELSAPLTAGQRTFEVRTDAKQPHEVELIRLEPGKTAKDVLGWLEKMEGQPPGQGLGGVAGVVAGMPVYFSADLTPGEYLLICFLPDAKDGKPHFAHGMMKTVRVT
jgi:hypothetical protein